MPIDSGVANGTYTTPSGAIPVTLLVLASYCSFLPVIENSAPCAGIFNLPLLISAKRAESTFSSAVMPCARNSRPRAMNGSSPLW